MIFIGSKNILYEKNKRFFMKKQKILILCENSKVFSYPLNHSIFEMTNTILNLDFRINSIPEIKKLLLQTDKEFTVVGMDSDSLKELRKNKIPHNSFEEFVQGNSTFEDKKAIKLIRNAFTTQNKEFKDLFYYDNIFLWDLIELPLYREIAILLPNIELIKSIIEKIDPDVVRVNDPGSVLGKIVKFTLQNREISYESFKSNRRLKHFLEKEIKIHIFKLGAKIMDFKELTIARRGSLNYNNQKNDFGEKKYKVLILTEELRHMPQIIPLAQKISKNREIGFMVISKYPWPKKNENLGIHFKTFHQYDKGIEKSAKFKAKNIISKLANEGKCRDLTNLIKYNQMNIFDLVNVFYIFESHFSRIIGYIDLTKRIIDIEKPDLIVVMDERSWPGKTIVKTCLNKSIPSLVLQHGIHGSEAFHGPTHATKLAVYGEHTKRTLIHAGVDPNKIVITGGQQWDDLIGLLKTKNFSKNNICKRLGLNKDKKIVLFAGLIDYNPTLGEKELKTVLKAVKKFPHLQLLIRAHPVESVERYKSICRELAIDDAVIIKKPHDYDSILACDIFITQYSTVALDAIIADKPVITINLSKSPDVYPYAKSGAALGVYKEEEMVEALDKIINEPGLQEEMEIKRKKFISEHIYKTDCKATNRIIDIIIDMIKNKYIC